MRTDLIWRAVLPVAAVLALVVGAPRPVAGGLVLLALAAVAERLVRLRRLGLTDRVLVGVGGVLVTLVLTGMVLGSTPIGLRTSTWVVALALVSVVGLAVSAVLTARDDTGFPGAAAPAAVRVTRRRALLVLPWVAAAVAVVVVSVSMSSSSLATADAKPLEMSFGTVTGTQVQVVVSDSAAVGPLEVRTAAAAGGDKVSYPLFSLQADGTRTTTVTLPATGRYVVTLAYPGQTQPLRTLILDR